MKPTKNQAIQTALTGDWTQAISINKSLLEENPKDVEALNRMGLAYMIIGKTKDAKTTYQKVLDIDPLNSIAIKNLKKIKTEDPSNDGEDTSMILVSNTFLEETGKTKVVDLVNTAPQDILMTLRTGQTLELSVKRLKVFVSQGKKYVGALPDDIGNRLIKFMTGGNKYEAFVKSAGTNGVTIFIRELKRSTKFKDQPSFVFNIEKKLTIKKGKKTKTEEDYEEEEDASPAEE